MQKNQRKTERVRFPLPVRINVTCEGRLIDLSEGGALLRVPRHQKPEKQVTLAIQGRETVHLAARVVRSTPVPVDTRSAPSPRTEYEVAVAFLDAGQATGAKVRHLIQMST